MNWFRYVLLAMLIQGTVLFLVKLLSFSTNPLTVLLYQYIGSLITLSAYLVIKKSGFKVERKYVKRVLLSGFLVSTGLSFLYLGIGLMRASIVAPIHSVGLTLLPALLGFAYLKEKASKRVLIGILCSVLSIILLIM